MCKSRRGHPMGATAFKSTAIGRGDDQQQPKARDGRYREEIFLLQKQPCAKSPNGLAPYFFAVDG